jgi:hypothetical protein
MSKPDQDDIQNGLEAAEFIPDDALPRFLLKEMRITRRCFMKTSEKMQTQIQEVTQLMETFSSRMNQFEGALPATASECAEAIMQSHLEYHATNEKRWGLVKSIRDNWWKVLVLSCLVFFVLGAILRPPIKKVWQFYRDVKASGLIQ